MSATDEHPDMTATLAEAQLWLFDRLDAGVECPCCLRFAKRYRRTLHSTQARNLIAMYRRHRREWVHLPTLRLELPPPHNNDEPMMRHWGLIVESAGKREDGGRAGWWRITGLGEDWLRGQVTIPKYVYTYADRAFGSTGPGVSAGEVLGEPFDLRVLTAA